MFAGVFDGKLSQPLAWLLCVQIAGAILSASDGAYAATRIGPDSHSTVPTPAERDSRGSKRSVEGEMLRRSIADRPTNESSPREDAGEPLKQPVPHSLQFQPFDDPVLPFKPRTPMSPDEQARGEAISWFLVGRLNQTRRDLIGAYEAYSKSLELDPDAIEVYRELIPLAFRLRKTEEASSYVDKFLELDPDNVQFLKRLGEQLVAIDNYAEGVKVLEKASQSTKMVKESGAYVETMRLLGILYRILGKTQEAADAYEVIFDALVNPTKYDVNFRARAMLLQDPQTSYERIGQVFLDAKRPELAIQAFQRAAESQTGTAGALSFNLAQVYFQTKQYDKALEELQKYLDAQLQSKGASAYQLLADILDAMGKKGSLIERLEDLAAADRHNSTLQYFLAAQYVAADRLEDGERLYQETLNTTGDADGYVGLSEIYRRQRRAEDLLRVLGKALESRKNLEQLNEVNEELVAIGQDKKLLDDLVSTGNKLLAADQPDLSFTESYLLAKLAGEAKETDSAVAFYRFALSAGRERANLIYDELGRFLIVSERFADAAQVYEEALTKLSPALTKEKVKYLSLLAQARMYNGDTNLALDGIKEALNLVPDNAGLRLQEALVYSYSRQWDRAIELFEKIIDKYSDNDDVVRSCRFNLSNVYVQRGDYEKGQMILEKVFAEDPEATDVNNDLGYLYADQGKNLEKAEKMIRKALDSEPENGAYLDSMGWVLFKLGKYDEALTQLKKASDKPTGADPTIWDHLGDCYQRLNQRDKAIEAWKKSLEYMEKKPFPDTALKDRIQEKLKSQPLREREPVPAESGVP